MYISSLNIEGYKNCKDKARVELHKGLNILVGENAAGKTTIINALRMILRENEFSYMNVCEDDFYKSFNDNSKAENIKIDLEFEELSPDEEVTFLTWCDADFKAKLHLEVNRTSKSKNYYKKSIWGGASKVSAFEDETFDCIECIYFPPLRDAEEKLTNGRKSRLAMLLQHQYTSDDQKNNLVKEVHEFNQSIVENKEKKFNEIEKAKDDINHEIKDTMGVLFGQSVNLQFSEMTFMSILQSIKMMFFPQVGERDINKFRDIELNSLGYNNLLYIATVFAELDAVERENTLLTVLLIEEPEAHLHPQLQIKLIKYLQQLTEKRHNIQVIITTHSPVLASSVSIDNLIHIIKQNETIKATSLFKLNLGNSKNYINRWLDVTKSTLLFSKGVVFVEGISECMLIPEFSKIVLNEYNKTHKTQLASSLEESGVSVVNINGINFKHFMKLFCNLDDNLSKVILPFRCSGITDKDPSKIERQIENKDGKIIIMEECYPLPEENIEGNNSALELLDIINSSKYARLFPSKLKTFEYDLAMENNTKIMCEVIRTVWNKKGAVTKKCQEIENRNSQYKDDIHQLKDDSIFILQHIESDEVGKGMFAQELANKIHHAYDCEIKEEKDRQNLEHIFNVPKYISDAIIWACGGEIKND